MKCAKLVLSLGLAVSSGLLLFYNYIFCLVYFLGRPVNVTGPESYPYMGFYSATSDDQVFRYLALTYARNHPIMQTGITGCSWPTPHNFTDGIINGAHW